MAELILEFVNPGRAPSINELNRMQWPARRRLLADWRAAVVTELRYAALHRQAAWAAVAGKACTVQLDIGVARLGTQRDPHNYASGLAKAIIDELRLQPAYGGFSPGNHARPARLRDKDGKPMFVNRGWALWVDDTAAFVELIDAKFHRGPTTRVIITTKECDGQVQESDDPAGERRAAGPERAGGG